MLAVAIAFCFAIVCVNGESLISIQGFSFFFFLFFSIKNY